MTQTYETAWTALVLVDPYTDFFAEDGTVTLVKDATAAFSSEHMHAAVELNGPLYAESVLTTADVIARLKG